jgi:hypothetical protein
MKILTALLLTGVILLSACDTNGGKPPVIIPDENPCFESSPAYVELITALTQAEIKFAPNLECSEQEGCLADEWDEIMRAHSLNFEQFGTGLQINEFTSAEAAANHGTVSSQPGWMWFLRDNVKVNYFWVEEEYTGDDEVITALLTELYGESLCPR